MRLKITLTLLVILLGLLTYIFYVDPWDEAERQEDQNRNALSSLAVDLDFLRIANTAKNQSITLQKKDDRWMLTEPYTWPANTFAVERILTQLQFLDTKVSFETNRLGQAGSSLVEYGLAPPDLTLEFGRGKNRYKIGIGNATAIGDHLYLLSVDRHQIHVVDRSLLDSLSINIGSLRNPRIFKSGIFEVDSWNLQLREANNLRTRLSKSNDQWSLETPIRARADTIEANTLLGRLLELKALRIVEPTPVDTSLYGLQDPFLRIAVESDQTREALEVGNSVKEDDPSIRYAKLENRDTVFELKIDYLNELENAQTNLRDRHVFETDVTRASSISFKQRGTEIFALQVLETDEWEILIPNEETGVVRQKGSKEAVEDALSWLSKVKAFATADSSGFEHDAPTAADLESYGLEVPEFSISVASNWIRDNSQKLDSPIVETLLFGDLKPEDRNLRYVKLKGSNFVYSVSNDTLERILNQAFQYRDRNLYDFPEDATITQLSISRLATGDRLLEASSEEANLPYDFLKSLNPIRPKAFLLEAYAPSVLIAGKRQAWAYQIKATYQWRSGDSTQSKEIELYASELTGGPFLAGASVEQDTVFEYRQAFIDTFSAIVFDRVKRSLPAEPFDPSKPLPSAEPQPGAAGND